jgi:hypothetical protein
MEIPLQQIEHIDEAIINKIYLIRGQKVMFDRDLAKLYDVDTKQLKRQVKRNIDRFPDDFMFELNEQEFKDWRCHFGTSISNPGDKMGLRYAPYVFTEQGVAMLSSVLNSERAIKVNIQIMRIYMKMRAVLMTNQEILLKLERLENKVAGHDENIQLIFKYLKELLVPPEQSGRRRIGFRRQNEEQ